MLPSSRHLALATLSATLLLASPGQALVTGTSPPSAPVPATASVTITITPPNPGVANKFRLTLRGTAPAGGRLGTKHNRARVDILEQIGGHCSRTPQGEFAKAVTLDLGPLYVRKGPFAFRQVRVSTVSSATTIRFCGYLSTTAHHVVARATAAYTS